MMPWRIYVTLAGRIGPKKWVSGDIRFEVPGWSEQVFASPLEHMELLLPGGRLVLAGMGAYNFFIEGLMALGSRRIVPQAFHLLGRLPGPQDMVSVWTVPPRGLPCHSYQPWGREYHGTPTAGWQPGATGGAVISRIEYAGMEICGN